jgi:hypothetical protein
MTIEDLFDGWVHYLEPDSDFDVPGDTVCLGIEQDEDEDLQPYESGTPIVTWQRKPGAYGDGKEPEGRSEEATWGGVTLSTGSLVEIIGGSRKAYQENTYDEKHNITRRYSFQFIPGDTGFQEGRL